VITSALFVTVILSGRFLARYFVGVYTFKKTSLDRIFLPFEKAIYRLVGINQDRGMGWREYFLSALFLNIVQMSIAFVILIFQGNLPLNTQGFKGLTWDLALNIVVSFATNTNLQHYNGESSLSYLSQMAAIQFLQFISAATGICFAVALSRCFAEERKDLGNFYVDFVRTLTRVLLPLSFIASIVLVAMGVPQTLQGYITVRTIEGATQSIMAGPVASLVSIMQLGTNGGGYYGANSAFPFQNPSPFSNIFEIFLMMLIPTSLIFFYGFMISKKDESRPILIASYGLLIIDIIVALIPGTTLGPGIETRIGGFFSTLWTVITTGVNTGSVNASLSAMNPLAILSAFIGMFVQATPGSDGVGLMYMVMYIMITVFLVGLMSGRTPEYLGIKITARDVKLVMLAFLIHPVIILVPTILAYATGAAAQLGIGTNPVGFTQVLYEFTSSAANNGSDFFGSNANTLFFNLSTAAVMFAGRYIPVAILLALSGSMIGRKRSSSQTFRTGSITFSLVLLASILLVVVLTFFPVLALGPLLEYLMGLSRAGG
jgi:K+-transporting ATPase ATPase A chain